MPQLLTDIHVTKVDLVGLAANKRKVTLFKSQEKDTDSMERQELLELLKGLEGEERDAVLEAWDIKVPTEDSILQKVLKALNPPQGEPAIKDEEVRTAIETLEKQNTEKDEKLDRLEKALAEREEADRRAKAIEKADTLAEMGFTAEDAEHFESLPDAIYDKLVAFKKQSDVAALFSELGKPGGEASALDKIAKAAEEIRKAHPDMGEAEAKAKAIEDNPKLYEAYLGENPKQVQ
jgi:hypothetical protein